MDLPARGVTGSGVAFGVELDLTSASVPMDELRARVRREINHGDGLVVLRGFATGDGVDAAARMEELMLAFGDRECMSSFSNTPMDPAESAEGGDENAEGCHLSGFRVRRLGNTVNPITGKPSSLLAKAGYEWFVGAFWVLSSFPESMSIILSFLLM